MNKDVRHRGAQKRNQNAAKERRKSSQVVFRCFEEDREAWEACAKAENLSLAAWICKTLNQHKTEPGHSKTV